MDHIKEYEEFMNEEFTGKYLYMDKKTPLKLGDLVEVQVVTGRYGQTATYQGKITKMPNQYGTFEIDNEYDVSNVFAYDFKTGNMVGYEKHVDYEHGHERYVKKIDKGDYNPKMKPPMRYRPEYTVWLVDYTKGKNKDKSSYQDFPRIAEIKGTAEFEKWLAKEYPKAVKKTSEIHKDLVKKYDRDWYKQYPYLQVHQSAQGMSGYLTEYIIGYKK